jgi:regulator of protease activity HflC (stomatin/prohibitin superfamily)
MRVVEFVNQMFMLTNDMLDVGFLWGGLILLLAYPLYFFFSNFNKAIANRQGRDLTIQTLIAYLEAAVGIVLWFLPEILWAGYLWFFALPFDSFDHWADVDFWLSSWRMLLLFVLFGFSVYALGHEHGKDRWQRSLFVFLGSIALGWGVKQWVGILFISIPLLWAYFAILHDLALIIVPFSNPENRKEQRNRGQAFLSYTWGVQSPMYLVDDHAWKKYDPRISGDITWQFSDLSLPFIGRMMDRPGMIWTPAHQVAAISGGTTFKRIEMPGVSFMGKLERPDQIFDLRLQIRSGKIDVISKDGVHFSVVFFIAFRVDNQTWDRETYLEMMGKNIQLRNANHVVHSESSFPFSPLRVQATLATTSTMVVEGTPLLYWDQWAMNVVEDQTRKVISQKTLDELWRPPQDRDHQFANALDIIADEIKKNSENILRSAGILLAAARVVNFSFPPKVEEDGKKADDISRQQLDSWISDWERKRKEKLAKAQAEADYIEQEARVFAESLLLNTVVESLQKAQAINPDLPRDIIAMRFLSALQDYAKKQTSSGSEEEAKERQKRMADLRKEFKSWQETFYPEEG